MRNPNQRYCGRLARSIDVMLPVCVILALWQILAGLRVLNPNALPPPSEVAAGAFGLVSSGALVENVAGSIGRVVLGFVVATILGVISGTLLGIYPSLGRRTITLIEMLRPIPPIAWIPLAILWFGLGNRSSVFIVAVGAFFPIFVNTYSGIRSVSQAHIDAARCLGSGTRLLVVDVLVPAASPAIFTGLRIGIGTAWTSVIAAEMVGAHEGLGYAIQLGRTMLETEAVIVDMIVIGMVGWAMNQVVVSLERRLIRWNRGTLGEHTG